MRLTNHIARRFLTDPSMIDEICDKIYPGGLDLVGRVLKTKSVTAESIDAGNLPDRIFEVESEKDQLLVLETVSLFALVCPYDQRAYWITDSIHDKLDLLKVKVDNGGHYDWRFFKDAKRCKKTFILQPDKIWTAGGCLRLLIEDNKMMFCHICVQHVKGSNNKGNAMWTLFTVDITDNKHCKEFYTDKGIKDIYEFVYKLMCFVFLSENEEEILPAHGSRGTKKSGKFKNDLDIPIIFLSSKWNITSIRNEGFNVSGHFRLQPYKAGAKMIFIEPFEKHGYVRKAKSLTENL